MSPGMLSARVLETVQLFSMIRPKDRIVVGLSGGPDSVALASLLFELAPSLGVSLELAHLNHALRKEADEDEAFCRELARRLGLPFASETIDVAAEAARHKRSIEDEARRLRYRFLERRRVAVAGQRIAVGHTLDDQAETFLLRLLRGSGTRGLASVYPVVEGTRIRPLLELRRSEILDYLDSRGLAYRNDASNDDPRFVRNRIRREELPRLRERYNPRLVETLARSASILRDEEDWMAAETEERFSDVAAVSQDGVTLDLEALARCPVALARRVIRRSFEVVRGDLLNLGSVHVADVLALSGPGKSGKGIHLPGLIVERSFDRIRVRPGRPRVERGEGKRGYNSFEYRLSIPTRVRIPESGGVFSAEIGSETGASVSTPAAGDAVVLGITGNLPELKLRSPRPGDRFHPLGAPGSKPLTRYLMERKVGREERCRVPVLVRMIPGADSSGRPGEEILWVVGHGVSEASRVSALSRRLSLEWVAR